MNKSVFNFCFQVFLVVGFLTLPALGQSDTLAIEFNDGTVNLYPLAKVLQVSFAGIPTSAQEHELANILTQSFALRQNYPNPFNPSTTIEYELPTTGEVALEIFNMLGQRVRLLMKGTKNPGLHKVQWDARDDAGAPVPSGAYLCRVQFRNDVVVNKLLLVR